MGQNVLQKSEDVQGEKGVQVAPSLTSVVCVCSARDIDVWAVAAPYICRNIMAKNYVLVVPDRELAQFQEQTPGVFRVVAESVYLGKFRVQLQALAQITPKRYGWYFQQLIKLSFLETAEADDVFLIWDADTIPLKPLQFIESDGALRYYRSEEFHKPYFTAILRLLGMDRTAGASFIAQCFAIRGCWAKQFFAHIEARHQMPWMDALIESVDFSEQCGFSEYEALGTFLAHTHADEMRLATGQWDRCGRSLTGEARYIDWPIFKGRVRKFDFVAFEKWDQPFESFPGLIRRILRLALIRRNTT